VLICRGETILRDPKNQQIADCLGFNQAINETQVRDLVFIGAGPSGLAAAVYGATVLESAASCVTRKRYNQLNYVPAH
jgi:thioredoxin reductase (NADPH)